MKARIKGTDEIVDVVITQRVTHTGEQVYMTYEGCLYEESRLDFYVEPIDYWTRLEHQYAGMAMQGILAHEGTEFRNYLLQEAMDIAHALVEKLKESK